MHKYFLEVSLCWLLIFSSAKTSKAFISNKCMNIAFVDACYHNIDSQIKFKSINQKRLLNISLYNCFAAHLHWNCICIIKKDYPISLGSLFWLSNKYSAMICGLVCLQLFYVLGENKWRWDKIKDGLINVASNWHHSFENTFMSKWFHIWVSVNYYIGVKMPINLLVVSLWAKPNNIKAAVITCLNKFPGAVGNDLLH